MYRLFLISPANLSGPRAGLILDRDAKSDIARRLRTPEGVPLGEVYSFVSGLYFRGKATYAETFGRAPPGLAGGLVISPTEGLRFLHEPVTLDRLLGWANVDIDEANPRFTGPLLQHAEALERAYGAEAEFVLLGSVATEKYVGPLCRVFDQRLLFPPAFVGRGDMSRGALLLRAARSGRELDYAPVTVSLRHGPRAPSINRQAEQRGPTEKEMVILVGLPGAGKSTFFRRRYAATHVHVSKDNFRNNARPGRRQNDLVAEAFTAGRSVVVDNTNPTIADRAELIAEARRHGARVIGYFFDVGPAECLGQNARREGRARVPRVAIFATAKRLVAPTLAEGFDELYRVRPLLDEEFEVDRVEAE